MGRTSDLRLTVASFGTSIPQCWGQTRVPGTIIWGTDLIEHENDINSGGGTGRPKVTTRNWTYTVSLAIAICKGKSSNRVDKIYADDLVIFDRAQSGNTITPINDSFATQVGEAIVSAAYPNMTLRYYFGTETQNADALIISSASNSDIAAGADNPAFRGTCYAIFEDMLLTDFGSRVPNFSFRLSTGTTYLSAIVTDLVAQVDINTSTQLDVTAISAVALTGGLIIGSRIDVKGAIQPILDAYKIDLIDVDGKIRAVLRGGSVVTTLTFADIGATIVGSGTAPDDVQRIIIDRVDDGSLPQRLDLGYLSTTIDLQQATQGAVRQSARKSNNVSLQYPLSLTDTEARQMAERLLYLLWVERMTYQVSAMPEFANLCAADCIMLQIDQAGNTQRVRITEEETGLMGEIRLKLVKDLDSAYTQGTIAATPTGAMPSTAPVDTNFFAWSGTEIQDEDSLNAGFYVVATGDIGWQGCSVYVSVDGGTIYTLAGYISSKGVFGVTSTALGNTYTPNGNGFDATETVNVTVNGVLSDTDETTVLNGGGNYGLILDSDTSIDNSANYEILGFAGATLVTVGNYTLDDFLRAQRTTAGTGHTSSDAFVFLTTAVERIAVALSLVGSIVYVKCVSPGIDITTVTPQQVYIAEPTTIFATSTGANDYANSIRTPYWRIRGYLGGTKTTSINDTYFLNGVGVPGANHPNSTYLISSAVNFQLTYADVTLSTTDTTGTITQAVATGAIVQSALESLGNVVPGDVSVTGVAGGPWTVQVINSAILHNLINITGSGGVSVTTTRCVNDQYWEEASLSPIDIAWRLETPGVGYTMYLRINLINTTGSTKSFDWWVPARDNTLRVRLNGTFIYDNGVADTFGTETIPATTTYLLEIFYYNNPATYDTVDQGTAMFKSNALSKGLTWSDAGV